jgi:hypothetical protein
MSEYTFHSLSAADFEDLACDLLGAALKITFQSFSKGRDSGVDLLHGARVKGNTVAQCKHYSRSKFADLKHKIANEEVSKIKKLKPSRYILATSLGLTPQNKEELLGILAPFCKGVNDIYGQDDINALLREYPAVEKAHYKLWLTSIPVLQRVLRNGAVVWEAMTKEDITRKMSVYVQTKAYGAALKILAEHNYCVLSGIPGIGKTTLAQVLVTRLMDDGYELVAVRDDIQEAFDALDVSKPQVIYYDDFLGQSSIGERLGKNEDRGIVRLLAQSHRSKNLKVILTTREYILEDAKRVYEPLNSGEIDVAKCVVKVEDYTRGHRARILYNHVYFSALPHEYATALISNHAYRKIIDHSGYNPRIIEWMTLGGGPASIQPGGYVGGFLNALNDPTRVWQHAFDNQIGEDARAVLYCIGTTEGWLGLEELRGLWAELRGLAKGALSIEGNRAFHAALKQLDGSFVLTTRVGSETAVAFHNPSITDFVRKRIASDDNVRRELLRTALFFEQVSCLACLTADGHIGYVPSGLIPNDAMLHRAVQRTLNAQAATYRLVHQSGTERRRLHRDGADMGRRLSTIARWATNVQSESLLRVCCQIAADMIAAGSVARIATLGSHGFLDSVINAPLTGEQPDAIVKAFLTQIDRQLPDSGSTDDWDEWTKFAREHPAVLGNDRLSKWSQEVKRFCDEELQTIVENASSASEAEGMYDDLSVLADKWDYSLEDELEWFKKRLEELPQQTEAGDESDWRNSGPMGAPSGDDAEIDQLFDSLIDKAEG